MRHSIVRRVLPLVFVVLCRSGVGFAQAQPTYLSISPSNVYQGQCYVMTAGDGAYMTLDVQYTFNYGGIQTITGWPTLNGNGQANICTSTATAPGTYQFIAIRNSQGGSWVSVSATVIVSPPPPQPTSLTFNSSQGYAGNDCYTMSVGNGANMTVQMQYTINGISQPVWTTTLNAYGQWSYCLNHFDRQGTYAFTAIKNALNSQWVYIGAVYYTVRPPQPTSFSVTPSSITAGAGSYTMTGGNSADITLDVQYTLNNGPVQTIYAWPYLNSVSGSATGSASIFASKCTAAGSYRYTAVKNHANTSWVGVSAPITVYAPPAPTVSSLSKPGAPRGATVSVTIYGTNLCGVTLSTTWPGLTFSGITSDPTLAGSYITASFSVSATASVGNASITIAGTGGSTSFNFAISNNAAPSVTGMSPATGVQGTSVVVSISGANLTGASLSTAWNGLTFSNLTSNPQGLSLTATFNIAAGAPVGTPTIQVTTSAGSVNTQLFSIIQASVLTKEYIYFGDRIIAIENP